MYVSLHLDGDPAEMAPVLEALLKIKSAGKLPAPEEEKEKDGKKRRTKEQIAADEAVQAEQRKTLDEAQKTDLPTSVPVVPAPVIDEFKTMIEQPILPNVKADAQSNVAESAGKTYTDEELRAKAFPKIKELGQPKMQEVLKVFGIKSITEAGPKQRTIFMQKVDSYKADTDASKHFTDTAETVATSEEYSF